jgi:S-adenosylmethionine decarboxylase
MDTYGFHLIADLSNCRNIHDYDSESKLASLLRECAKAAKATVLMVNTHKFSPQGISATAILAESHITSHLYPEHNYISFDCFTCGNQTEPWAALELFNAKLNPEFQDITSIERGIPNLHKANAFDQSVEAYGFHAISPEESNQLILEF